MNKAELAANLAKENDLKKSFASELVDSLFEIVTKALVEGEKLTITGFGSLEVVTTKARVGRNPKTGEAVNIPAKKKVKWSASSTLKNALN